MLKSLITHLFRIALGLLFLLIADPAWAQNVPVDLEVIGTAGGLGPVGEYATVRIAADGQGTYHRYQSADLMSSAVESNTFALTNATLEQLWQTIQNGDFFNLETEYGPEDIVDGTYAELIITANSIVHTVTTENAALEAFDNIISTINALTPDDDDLVYDTSEPFTFIPRDICDLQGKQKQSVVIKQSKKASKQPAAEIITTAAMYALNNDAHPGTALAYHMTLQEAANRGIVTLSAKGGGFEGDLVSISIDNSGNATSDRLNLSLYLDLWGPGATESAGQMIKDAIEDAWDGETTTDGQTLNVDVTTRTTLDATSAPGLIGFHQIKLVTDPFSRSNVVGSNSGFCVNIGVGSGTWTTTGSLLDETYAHEAGHLFCLPDRYEEFRKNKDGSWRRKGDGKKFTSLELANELTPSFPDWSLVDILKWVEDGRRRVGIPDFLSEDDLMATSDGSIQQSDIDALAAEAGLVIEIRPGDILVNKDGEEQNFVIIRYEDIFVPPGGSKTLEGIYVSCIDEYKHQPSAGTGFDVAPSLSDWKEIEAAQLLQLLVDYIDDEVLFCTRPDIPHAAIWRITDNRSRITLGTYTALRGAGIDLDDQFLEFPHMTNLNAAGPNTSFLTPPQLFVPNVTSSTDNILDPGETVALTGAVNAPSLEGVSTVFSWSLDTPMGSAATLSSRQGETTIFTTDVRGIYHVLMQAEVTDSSTNTFTVKTIAPFTAADAHTATFETGILESGGPFLWETIGDNLWDDPWVVTDAASHTGVYSAASPAYMFGDTATLRIKFEHETGGTMSFAYNVSSEDNSDFLVFSINGHVLGSWSGFQKKWSTFSIDLTAGTHTAIWTYLKDSNDSEEGADRVWIDDVFFPESAIFTAIEGSTDDILPATYQLSQNYPNPFNLTTTISYAIPQSQHVTLVVYDALGRQVAILVDGRQNPGQYQVRFDARGLANGVYYYELRAATFRERKAMVFLK